LGRELGEVDGGWWHRQPLSSIAATQDCPPVIARQLTVGLWGVNVGAVVAVGTLRGLAGGVDICVRTLRGVAVVGEGKDFGGWRRDNEGGLESREMRYPGK
jgi:hypothetical protein